MRIIDDFLFITPDKAKAELFLKQMNKGQIYLSFGTFLGLSLKRSFWRKQARVATAVTLQ